MVFKNIFVLLFALQISFNSNGQVNLTQGLLLHLPFSGNAGDSSGNTNVVVVNGGPQLIVDRFGTANSAYAFDGVDDFMALSGGSGMKPLYPMSISAWVKLNDITNSVNNFFNNDFVPDQFYGVWANFSSSAGGFLSANIGSSGSPAPGSRRTKTSDVPLSIGIWTHVAAVVYSETSMRLFINCKEVTGAYNGTGGNLQYSGTGQTVIGIGDGGDATVAPTYINAGLDEIRFYNRALTDEEIVALYYYPALPPSAAFKFPFESINIGCDSTIKLNATTPGVLNYLWNTGDSTAEITIEQPGIYWALVDDGCTTKLDSVTVIGGAGLKDVFVPSAFTPNGDDINDDFGIYCLKQCFQGKLSIYNEWGERLFFSTDPINEFWNGTYKNKICTNGVYAYKLELVSGATGYGKIVLIR